jgi:hypothetical protein
MNRNHILIAITALLAFLYCLNRGIYVGSEVTGEGVYTKTCRYLFISGISAVQVGVGTTPEEASKDSAGCSLLAR